MYIPCDPIVYAYLLSRERRHSPPSEYFEDVSLTSCVREGQQTQRLFPGMTEVFLWDGGGDQKERVSGR